VTPQTDPNIASIDPNTFTNVGPVGEAHYTFVGRFDSADPNAVRFSFMNSKIGVQFTGTQLAVRLADTGFDMFNVVIDGAAPIVLAAQPNTVPQLYPVAAGLTAGTHTAWMTKRTEATQRDKITPTHATGAVRFAGFVLGADGTFLPPPAAKARLIEALGDSSCTGYGVDQTVHSSADACNYSIATQNADASVFAFAAQALDAELVNLSTSGRGIYTSQWDPNDLQNQLPSIYKWTVSPNPTPAWSFTGYTPDVVIINAGGDDVIGTAGNGALPDPNAFVQIYTQLLADIRAHYPKAQIVAALGSGLFGQDKVTITNAINLAIAARTAAGDTQLSLFDYFGDKPNGWTTYADAGATLLYGCEGHASTAGSKFLGEKLAAFLRTKLSW
jgi:lysophospholipase L1-like esterase